MLVIGLTGGIGAGKTTVANLFQKRGVPIVDADVIAHQLTQQSMPAHAAIIAHFGKELILPDGNLNRAQLRSIIFADAQQRAWLENLLHPLIEKEIANDLKNINADYCIVVIPLLLEVGKYDFIDRVLVVDTPEHEQINRVTTRDEVSKNDVTAIMRSQTSRELKQAMADDIIINDQDMAHLDKQVEQLHHAYQQQCRI